jgi:hypothetical protein
MDLLHPGSVLHGFSNIFSPLRKINIHLASCELMSCPKKYIFSRKFLQHTMAQDALADTFFVNLSIYTIIKGNK